MDFTITPIASAIAVSLRADIAAERLPARRVVLEDAGAPCRHCLQPGQPGEAMLLFTYQPFTGTGPYAVPSPIFLHADSCPPYDPADGIPALLADGLRAVRSYDADHDLLEGEVVPGVELTDAIKRLFLDDRAAYLHVHSATAGCFTCRVDRQPAASASA